MTTDARGPGGTPPGAPIFRLKILSSDLEGLAAIIAALDLVISVGNTTVHLAGSLAAPFTLDQVWAKFDGCAAPFLPPERLAAVRDALADLPRLPSIAPLMAPLYDGPR